MLMLGWESGFENFPTMSTEHLSAASRVLFGNELSPLLEKRALHQLDRSFSSGSVTAKESQVLACPSCHTLWIPGITCKVRSADHKRTGTAQYSNKSKASRKRRATKRENDRKKFEKKLKNKLGDKFKPLQLRYIHYRCLMCTNGHKVVQAFPPQIKVLNDSGGMTVSKSKSPVSKTKPGTKGNAAQPRPKALPSQASASAPSMGRGLNLQDFLL